MPSDVFRDDKRRIRREKRATDFCGTTIDTYWTVLITLSSVHRSVFEIDGERMIPYLDVPLLTF